MRETLLLILIIAVIIVITLLITHSNRNQEETILSTKNAFKFGFIATLGSITASSLITIMILLILAIIGINI